MPTANPFTDPATVLDLYADDERLARRTGALHRAKVSGSHVPDVIAGLAAEAGGQVALDVGCGRGTTTRALLNRLPGLDAIAVDVSPAMLDTARRRLAAYHARAHLVAADFHHMPLRDCIADLAVAAFCLYHSPRPATVIKELARCLNPDGLAILVTKSADSYSELDDLIASCGLDPRAAAHPSLYRSAHSDNLAQLAASALRVIQVIHDRHVFRFDDHEHLAEYLMTSPKYQLVDQAKHDPGVLAAELRRRTPDGPTTATSTITYVVAGGVRCS